MFKVLMGCQDLLIGNVVDMCATIIFVEGFLSSLLGYMFRGGFLSYIYCFPLHSSIHIGWSLEDEGPIGSNLILLE